MSSLVFRPVLGIEAFPKTAKNIDNEIKKAEEKLAELHAARAHLAGLLLPNDVFEAVIPSDSPHTYTQSERGESIPECCEKLRNSGGRKGQGPIGVFKVIDKTFSIALDPSDLAGENTPGGPVPDDVPLKQYLHDDSALWSSRQRAEANLR